MKPTERKFKAIHICTGEDEWVRKEGPPGPCPLYRDQEIQCEAVKSRKLEGTLSEKGRCLIVLMEFVRLATDDAARRNPAFYAIEEDESEVFNLDGLLKRLGRAKLDRYEISDWHNYMIVAARRAVLLQLIRRGAMPKNPKKPKCGDCENISKSRPYVCLLTDDPKLKGDTACDDYAVFSARRKGETAAEDDKKGARASGNETSLKAAPDQETIGWLASNPEELVLVDDLYQKADGALGERARKAKTSPKRKEYWEKHRIFLNMIELTMKGYSEADAKSELLKLDERDTKRDSRRRHLDRYWKEIIEFLENEVFDEDRELFKWFRRRKGGEAHD